jgi:mannose-6-phosphate isomerase-like protein (cupin superfamily)
MNHTQSQSKTFKRTTSLELSRWYMGIVLTNLVQKKDSNGAFSLLEAILVPGNEPPPHVHTREDELFYVLEGDFDVFVGEESFNFSTK